MAATIKDIARQLNISVSTVSYALNNGPRPVPPDVRDRVLAVAREMDYRPNSLARSMATGRTDTIAIVPPLRAHPLLLSPYLLTVMNGLVEAAAEARQDILLHNVLDAADTDDITRMILSGKADSVVIIAPLPGSPLVAAIAKRNFPCAVFSSDGLPGTLTITTDNAIATTQALDHLLALRHRHIAHVAGRTSQRDGAERLAAYRHYMKQRDLPLREDWIVGGDFTYVQGQKAARQILTGPELPTAILAGNDESGLGVIDAARELGLRVPEDLSVIAYDELPQFALPGRRITSVRQPIAQMTEQTVRLLAQWAREGVPPTEERHVFPTEVGDYGSTAPPRREAER